MGEVGLRGKVEGVLTRRFSVQDLLVTKKKKKKRKKEEVLIPKMKIVD